MPAEPVAFEPEPEPPGASSIPEGWKELAEGDLAEIYDPNAPVASIFETPDKTPDESLEVKPPPGIQAAPPAPHFPGDEEVLSKKTVRILVDPAPPPSSAFLDLLEPPTTKTAKIMGGVPPGQPPAETPAPEGKAGPDLADLNRPSDTVRLPALGVPAAEPQGLPRQAPRGPEAPTQPAEAAAPPAAPSQPAEPPPPAKSEPPPEPPRPSVALPKVEILSRKPAPLLSRRRKAAQEARRKEHEEEAKDKGKEKDKEKEKYKDEAVQPPSSSSAPAPVSPEPPKPAPADEPVHATAKAPPPVPPAVAASSAGSVPPPIPAQASFPASAAPRKEETKEPAPPPRPAVPAVPQPPSEKVEKPGPPPLPAFLGPPPIAPPALPSQSTLAAPPKPEAGPPPAEAEAEAERPVPRDIAFPKVELGQKRPAPLLSRRRRGASQKKEGDRPRLAPAEKQAAPRQIAAAPARPETVAGESQVTRSWTEIPAAGAGRPVPAWKKAGAYGVLALVVIGMGWLAYYYLRETRLEGVVVAPDFQIQEVAVVSDFREEAVRTAQDLFYEREPILKDIRERRDVVEGAKADIAGREERIRLLREQIDAANREVEAVIREAREASQRLWASAGVQLDEEYDQKLDEFRVRVENRVRDLNLPYDPASDIKSPEVWVNAFRLSLYDAPSNVNGADERVWVEGILAEWRQWQKGWDARVAAVKQEVERIQAAPKERIDEINRRIANLNSRIDETRTEMEPVQKELEVNQKSLDALLAEDQALQAEYFQRLLKTPDGRTRVRVPFDAATGKFSWRHIEKTAFKPGRYLLWVKATKGDSEYWSVVSFPIFEYGTTVLRIEPGALVSVADVLRAGSASAAKE